MYLYCATQHQMIMQDKLEKDRVDAKNALEEYVYEMRDKLSSSLENFVKEQVHRCPIKKIYGIASITYNTKSAYQ